MGYKKWTALFISLALAATIFISYLCIAEKASHDCASKRLPITILFLTVRARLPFFPERYRSIRS